MGFLFNSLHSHDVLCKSSAWSDFDSRGSDVSLTLCVVLLISAGFVGVLVQ